MDRGSSHIDPNFGLGFEVQVFLIDAFSHASNLPNQKAKVHARQQDQKTIPSKKTLIDYSLFSNINLNLMLIVITVINIIAECHAVTNIKCIRDEWKCKYRNMLVVLQNSLSLSVLFFCKDNI